MDDWSQQLLKLNFQKEKKEDGSTSYTLILGHRRDSYWTKITVKQVGSPTPDAWQVTCARSEIRVGLWKIHNTTQDISVVVHTSAQKMIEDINYQTSLKPSFLTRISNWSHYKLAWSTNIAKSNVRPTLNPDEIDNAISQADLSDIESEIIEYIRYIGVFNELSLKKALSMPSKPPALYRLCKACEKIGHHLPVQFKAMMTWSEDQSDDNIAWQGNLVCAIAYTCDGTKLQPENATSLYHTFAVHKELFNGLEADWKTCRIQNSAV